MSPRSLENLKRGGGGGRAKGLGTSIRKSTKDGMELSKFMLAIFRGQAVKAVVRTAFVPREDLKPQEVFPTLGERMEAATWLADRGFGKPRQALELTGEDGGPMETRDVTRAVARDFRSRVARLAARSGTSGAAPGAVG